MTGNKKYECKTNCWFCGAQMIWGGDYNLKDFDMEGDGIVAILRCPECHAIAQFMQQDDE